ncbi:hypothetical protein [Paenibacillus thalictri]|uniref:Uncharacterized protein n=1 Tax=Paenibacillus thalictri TaxID=2527873 RepID=A0A4Q9DFQ2_9BACL|nr:hypothetical protein [Paenibacillus thalictri]TBL70834.1 hypothetical protein EYB31_31805 [Paenibacillus thalictri]
MLANLTPGDLLEVLEDFIQNVHSGQHPHAGSNVRPYIEELIDKLLEHDVTKRNISLQKLS